MTHVLIDATINQIRSRNSDNKIINNKINVAYSCLVLLIRLNKLIFYNTIKTQQS